MPQEEPGINKNAEYQDRAHAAYTDKSFTWNKYNAKLDRKPAFVSSGTVK